MSVYDDAANEADKIRKICRSDDEWKKIEFLYWPWKKYRVTSGVEAEAQNKIISETEVNSACKILHDLVQIDFRNVATRIRKVSAELGKNVLSLNDKTFQAELEETANTLEGLCNELIEFENQIKARIPIVRKIQLEYQIVAYYNTGQFINYK